MKQAALCIVLALGVPCAASAGQNPPKDGGSQGIERMAKEFGLSEGQKARVESIFNAEKQKVEAIFNEQQEKLQAVQEETRSGLQEVLTPEQMARLEKKMQQRQPRKAR